MFQLGGVSNKVLPKFDKTVLIKANYQETRLYQALIT